MEAVTKLFLPYEEEKLIAEALLRHREDEGNAFVWLGDIETTMDSLRQKIKNAQVTFFYDDKGFVGILVCNVGNVWWSKKKFMIEELVLCVRPDYHGFARVAIAFLEYLAELWEVDAIIAGCYFQKTPQVVMNSYKKAGFTIDTSSCIKVMKNDIQ